MKVLVTGGAGYIGSHAVKELIDANHQVVVLDNFSHGHKLAVDDRAVTIKGDTAEPQLLNDILQNHGIEAVIHFAADIEVGESVTNPYKYYQNNFSHSLNLLHCMQESGVKKLVFSSTAAVYGNPAKTPIEETQIRNPINPYGRSKMMTEMAIEDFSRAHGLGFIILRYFNVAGAHPDGLIGEDHRPESHLLPRILKAAQTGSEVKIYGTDYSTRDGTCIRDYVHVVDLVKAHVLALDTLKEGTGEIYNIGSQNGFTVREVISACEKVTGLKLKVLEEKRRPGDPDVLVASSHKIKTELKWQPLYPSMETIVSHAWNWHRKHPDGYDSPAFASSADLKTK
jgi:UDP-glucose 4-epimerase